MAHEVTWSDAASDDLRDIETYLQAQDPRAAERLVGGIHDRVGSLAVFPEQGPLIKGDKTGKRRWLLCGNYRLAYRFEAAEQRVFILSVTHGSRQFPPSR